MKPTFEEKLSFEDALAREPKTLGQAKEQLAAIRAGLQKGGQNLNARRDAKNINPGDVEPIEAEPGEQIIIKNLKQIVLRGGKEVEVAAVTETRAYKILEALLKTEKDSRQRYLIASEMTELRKTYGSGRK